MSFVVGCRLVIAGAQEEKYSRIRRRHRRAVHQDADVANEDVLLKDAVLPRHVHGGDRGNLFRTVFLPRHRHRDIVDAFLIEILESVAIGVIKDLTGNGDAVVVVDERHRRRILGIQRRVRRILDAHDKLLGRFGDLVFEHRYGD